LYVGAGQVNEVWFGNYQPGAANANSAPAANTVVEQKPMGDVKNNDSGYDGQPVETVGGDE
jgi:hypothetical protein